MASIKQFLYKVLNKKPGKRFMYAYFIANKHISEHPVVRFSLVIAGVVFFLFGIVLLFIPGPGILFILLGLILFCLGSKYIAVYLDKIEREIRNRLN